MPTDPSVGDYAVGYLSASLWITRLEATDGGSHWLCSRNVGRRLCDANEPLHIVCDLIAEISGRTLASFAVAVAAVHGATRYGHCDVPSFVWQHPKEGRTTP